MWRVQAKHETVCPRCRGYIKLGAWIVQDSAYGRKWSHAVCPADLRRSAPQVSYPVVTRKFQIKFGDGNDAITTEML